MQCVNSSAEACVFQVRAQMECVIQDRFKFKLYLVRNQFKLELDVKVITSSAPWAARLSSPLAMTSIEPNDEERLGLQSQLLRVHLP
jgi:hypothetical protein